MRKKTRESNNFSHVTVEIKVYKKKKKQIVHVRVTNAIKSKMETIANITVFIHIDSGHSQKAIS